MDAREEVEKRQGSDREMLQAKEQSLLLDSLYHQRRYEELSRRLEKIDANLFRQCGISLQAWETSEFATLPRLATHTYTVDGLTTRPAAAVSSLTSAMSSMSAASPRPDQGKQ